MREPIRVMDGVPFGFLRDDIECSWLQLSRWGRVVDAAEKGDELRGFLAANDLLHHSAITEIDVLVQYFGRETPCYASPPASLGKTM